MERWICARRTMTGSPARLRTELLRATHEVVQAATGVAITPPSGDGSFEARLQARIGAIPVHKWVTVHLGEATTDDAWLGVPIRWEASGGQHVLPTFTGTIELATMDRDVVEVAVVGSYATPLGPIGGVGGPMFADVAQRTAEWLVTGIVGALADRVAGDAPVSHVRIGALTVADVMTRDVMAFATDTPLRAAASLLLRGGVSGAPVIGEQGKVVGILSEQDLLDKATDAPMGLGPRADARYRRFIAATVGEACSRPARTTEADTPIREAAKEMATHRVARLVVLEGATVAGIVTRTDVLKALVRDDDDTAAAVGEVLASLGVTEVQVDVAAGVVRLAGTLPPRSRPRAVAALGGGVDGVIEVVDDDLGFDVDDVTPVSGLSAFGV